MPNFFDSIPAEDVAVAEMPPASANFFDAIPADEGGADTPANFFDSIPDDTPAQPLQETALNQLKRGFLNLASQPVQAIGNVQQSVINIAGQAPVIGPAWKRALEMLPAPARWAAPVAREIQGMRDEMSPVDPRNARTATVAGAVPTALGMIASGGTLGAPAALGLAGSMGAQQGFETADEIGVTSPAGRLATAAAIGGTEALIERGIPGLGGIAGKKVAGSALVRGLKGALGETMEEPLTGGAQDLVTRIAATEDPNNPGFTATGYDLAQLSPTDPRYLNKRGQEALGGAVGGAIFAGVETLSPTEDAASTIEGGQMFDAPAFEPAMPGQPSSASVTPPASPVTTPAAAEAPVAPTTDAGSTPAAGAPSQASGPGAAAASEYKDSEALKSIDPKRFTAAQRLNYRVSPEAELDQIAAQVLDEGQLESMTDQLLTQSPEEIGFTGREHVALAGQAMFRWEQRALAAEKAGDAAAQRTAEARAANLFELVQDGLNRGASVTQVGAYLMRSDPFFELKRSVAKIAQAQIDDTTAQTGMDPAAFEAEIKRRVQEELDKLGAQRDLEAEKEARAGKPRTPEGQAKVLINSLAQQFTDTSSGVDGPAKTLNQVKELVKRAMKGQEPNLQSELQALGVSEKTAVSLTGLAEEGARRTKTIAHGKAADRLIQSLQPKAPRAARSKVPPVIRKLLEAADLGMTRQPEFQKAYREAFGIPDTLNGGRMTKLRQIAQKIREARKGSAEQAEAMAEMQDELAMAKGIKVADLVRSGWYGSLLSGIGTQAVNIAQNAANGLRLAYRVAGDVIANRDFASMVGILDAGTRGAKSGWRGFADTLRTGHAYKGGEKYGDTSAAELAVKAWDEIGPLHKAVYYAMAQGATRRVSRLLAGADVAFNYTYRELASSLAAVRAARAHGHKPGTPEFRKAYEDELGIGDAKWTDFISRAQAEITAAGSKPQPGELSRRALEMANTERAATLRDEAHLLADRITLQQEPEGIGKAISGIISAAQKVPVVGRSVVPFNKIVSNFFSEAFDYTPVGMLRAWKGGSLTGGAKGRRYSKAERMERALASATGTGVALAAMAAAMGSADDDDGSAEFMIYGWGPTNPRQRDYWKAMGGKPYSIKIGGKWLRYSETPFAFPLAIAGSFMDQHRYGDKTQSWMERAPLAIMASTGAVINFGPLAGPAKIAKTWTEAEQGRNVGGQIKDTVSTVLGLNGYMPVSGFARDMKMLLDPQKIDSKTLYGALLKDYPYFGPLAGKPALNRFGEPLETDDTARIPGVRRFVEGRKADPLTDWLASNQVYVPQAKRFTTIDEPARGEMKLSQQEQRRSDQGRYLARLTNGLLTEDEQRTFHQLSGALLRDRLSSYKTSIEAERQKGRADITSEAINKRVEAMNEAANRVALYRMASEMVK